MMHKGLQPLIRFRLLVEEPLDRKKLYAAQKRHRVRVREAMLEYLSTKKCLDCNETDPIVMEFDHIDPKKKFRGIGTMLSGHWSWKSVLLEIEKCEIRCANCHRRKTYAQFKFWGKTKKQPS